MAHQIRNLVRSATTRYVVIAMIAFALASPLEVHAEDVAGGLVALQQRVAAAESAITSLQSAVTQSLGAAKAYADALVAAETSARQAADTTLQTNIDNETAARKSADTTLQGNIDAEATARATGDADTLTAAKAYADSKSVGSIETIVVQGATATPCGRLNLGCYAGTVDASCPSGYALTGGGIIVGSTGHHIQINDSRPNVIGTPNRWIASAQNSDPLVQGSVTAYAVCAKVK